MAVDGWTPVLVALVGLLGKLLGDELRRRHLARARRLGRRQKG